LANSAVRLLASRLFVLILAIAPGANTAIQLMLAHVYLNDFAYGAG
jgi:hypothetical protein